MTNLTPDLDRSGIIKVMRRACDYQLEWQRANEGTPQSDINSEWVRGAFYTGVPALYDVTDDAKYLDATLSYADGRQWQLDIPATRHADWQCVGQLYLELYLRDARPHMIEAIQRNVDAQMAVPIPGRDEWWWCDALYMAPPMLALLARATGDGRYSGFLNTMYWDAVDYLYDPAERLFFRDKNYFNARARNGQRVYWSRGNGWVAAGLARIMTFLPDDTLPNERARFETLFIDLCRRIAPLQHKDGLWRTSLLDPDEFPVGETSGTALFVYAMAWGVNAGLLPREEFEATIRRGWAALAHAVTPQGRLGYVQIVAAAPGPVSPDDTREYAVGAFLLAGREVLAMFSA